MSTRFASIVAVFVTACTGPAPQGTLSPTGHQIANRWLLCEECIAGEREAVLALGQPAVLYMDSVLASVPASIIDPLRTRLYNSWTPALHPDRDQFTNTFVENARARAQKRAALTLGDLDAVTNLQAALAAAPTRGYRADVVQIIRGSITAASSQDPGGTVAVVRVSPTAHSMVIGESDSLAAFVEDADGNLLNPLVTWSSSNTAVVSAQLTGRITAVSVGVATIKATSSLNSTVSASATVTVTATGPTILIVNDTTGNGQSGAPGATLPDTLRVQVTTTTGNPAAGVAVTWAVLAGGGTVTPIPAGGPAGGIAGVTNAAGVAAATYVLGPAGQQRIEARVAGSPAFVFRAVARVPSP